MTHLNGAIRAQLSRPRNLHVARCGSRIAIRFRRGVLKMPLRHRPANRDRFLLDTHPLVTPRHSPESPRSRSSKLNRWDVNTRLRSLAFRERPSPLVTGIGILREARRVQYFHSFSR